jgi:hypothetical protein
MQQQEAHPTHNTDHERSSISNGVEGSMLIPGPGGLRPRRRAIRGSAELATGLRGPAILVGRFFGQYIWWSFFIIGLRCPDYSILFPIFILAEQ